MVRRKTNLNGQVRKIMALGRMISAILAGWRLGLWYDGQKGIKDFFGSFRSLEWLVLCGVKHEVID